MRGTRGKIMPTWEQIHKALETVRAEAHEQFDKNIEIMKIPNCPREKFREAATEMFNSIGKTTACTEFFIALSKLERESFNADPIDIRKIYDTTDVN